MKRTLFIVGLTFLLAMTFAIPAFAGGWAVVTLDELPAEVEAGQPFEIGFMVRQHGVTPLSGQSPIIRAYLDGAEQSVRVMAEDDGKAGHYAATLTIPESGTWQWEIEAFGATQPMPALTVVDASVTVAKSEPVAASNSSTYPLLVGGIGLLGTIGGLLALQRKVRWATAFVMVGILVSGVGFVSAAGQPRATSEAKQPVILSADEQVSLGRNLFIAKGCTLCHSHSETNKFREFGVDMGPNLTNFTASPDYLRLWLKDPSAVKSTAKMPALGMSVSEIEALIAFINDK